MKLAPNYRDIIGLGSKNKFLVDREKDGHDIKSSKGLSEVPITCRHPKIGNETKA